MMGYSKEHIRAYGPTYVLLMIVTGSGGAAAITDNIPMTQGQFERWRLVHVAVPHDITQKGLDINQVGIDLLGEALDDIRIEQTRAQLRQAYNDKCGASGAALTYIDKEIDRLEDIYFKLTTREYDPPPCN